MSSHSRLRDCLALGQQRGRVLLRPCARRGYGFDALSSPMCGGASGPRSLSPTATGNRLAPHFIFFMGTPQQRPAVDDVCPHFSHLYCATCQHLLSRKRAAACQWRSRRLVYAAARLIGNEDVRLKVLAHCFACLPGAMVPEHGGGQAKLAPEGVREMTVVRVSQVESQPSEVWFSGR